MATWAFYPVLVGTVVSILGLGRIAIKERHNKSPETLSELAAAEEALLTHFRNILIVCGLLFAITIFWFIVPRLAHGLSVAIFGALMIGGELFAAVFPARGKMARAHMLFAQLMAVGMFGLGVAFATALSGVFLILEMTFTASMALFALFTLVDKERYIAYELAFIFSSHFSVLVAALALK